ncbi:ribosomal-protein-alanine N-acetyltransferase [Paenibacillus algorifonticola]|uniref:Ribosomal-protein-alanine N-acetyltransferase n=1 Tax=Paenibacillus algorifonticola TaxID=684063 RepID=A0A1I1YIY8_9BACL|nr:GNAT family protein [Paenibacillus algorifonticola]SFE19461.1 ribosomal-protein-alanine N-acetyltransferase [Paenibacillus algorifonticola]
MTIKQSIYLKPLELADAEAMLVLRLSNQAFLQPVDPVRPDNFLTLEGQQEHILLGIQKQAEAASYPFGIMLEQQLIGRIELSNVIRGPLQNANVGYFLDRAHQGNGYVSEAVRLVTAYAFEQLDLHRLQAGVMPRNTSSIRVLERTGFRQEGLALRYLKINGVWEDHLLFALTAEEYKS